ncbi:uncharacterized protein MELLADRAFT_64905 [Melampsora larici-populina 98AG31]|uniref:Mtf2-like C-terminal domain-containing protein n=1 Tax=Melampsora larici-populina (strain 98AG31 / pathotype 3-4-7) TaxID=747676 RepID=F4RT82_MELLP|nr:uncharacterized protein MELLADRAFT_64905 [Melampsora larici-populina 98AG31]EGG04479.1 hypothetical protein MELLADRAFT_64905 [Melampsora larici-populina 98AG31]
MNHRERMIALDLLQDLSIPKHELNQEETNLSESTDQEDRNEFDFFNGSEYQTILKLQTKSTLNRKRTNFKSLEDIQLEDMMKEIIDEKIHLINQIETDHALLEWVEKHFMDHQNHQSNPKDKSSKSMTQTDESLSEVNLKEYIEFSKEISNQKPICLSPISSKILLHLIQTFYQTFYQPNLSLYLFNYIRNHSNPMIKYLGLSSEIYEEILKLHSNETYDLFEIKELLIDMKTLGLEINDEIQSLIKRIIELMIKDEMNAERIVKSEFDSRRTDLNGLELDDQRNEFKMIQKRKRFNQIDLKNVSIMENLLNEIVLNQKKSF